MVLVTDKQFYMEPRLKEKLDLMIERLRSEDDNLLLVEGDEGSGKTTLSIEVEYYVAHITGRVFSNASIHFDAAKLVDIAKRSYDGLYIWDEPAMEGLSNEWWNENQRNLVKLLMMARKRRHFIVFNVTKFYKFAEYIVRDRPIGMIKVYKRDNLTKGHFLYYSKKKLIMLYDNWKRTKRKEYNKFHSFRGTFPDLPSGIIDKKRYEDEKDNAILSIGVKKVNENNLKYSSLMTSLATMPLPVTIKSYAELSRIIKITPSTLREYRYKPIKNEPNKGDAPVLTANAERDIKTLGLEEIGIPNNSEE